MCCKVPLRLCVNVASVSGSTHQFTRRINLLLCDVGGQKGESGPPADAGGKGASKKGGGGGTAVKVRHILCEKQSKCLEAMEKLRAGESFNLVAQQYSEDKARNGVRGLVSLSNLFSRCAFSTTK